MAGCVVIAITMILNTKDYMGAGNELIARAIETGQARPLDFLWKMILTAVTMRAGYRGGEIVPAFSVGATFGCVAGQLLGFQPELAAAAGMVAFYFVELPIVLLHLCLYPLNCLDFQVWHIT